MSTSEHNSSHSIPQPFTFGDAVPPSFQASGGGTATSLDEPLVAQTKREIKTLAAEIRELVSTSSNRAEFLAGFLPRLVTAMGAEASGLWQVADGLRLVATHSLPANLISKKHPDQPAAQHRQVLDAAYRAGKPVLVPPNGSLIEENRPNNPTEFCLIFVPVRLCQDIDFVLEVVHNSRGGPAAQRGYLRFVSQMSDLLGDFLRRDELQKGRAQLLRHQTNEENLLRIAASPRKARAQVAVDCLCEMLSATQVILLDHSKKPAVQVISGVTQIDPRSEVVLAVQELAKLEQGNEPYDQQERSLCNLLGCEAIFRNENPELGFNVIVAGDASLTANCQAQASTLDAVGNLLHASQSSKRLPSLRLQKSLTRILIACAILGLGAIPVPQQVAATATMEPVQKQTYYAPVDCTVAEVQCSEGELVKPGQPLLRLESDQLTTDISAITGRRQQVRDRILEQTAARDRGFNLSSQDIDRLEAEIRQLRVEERTLEQQLTILQKQVEELNVFAKVSGQVETWDIQNQLRNRPVRAGQKLLGTFDSTAGWELQVTIPEKRLGLVSHAVAENPDGSTRVHFTLPSLPQQSFTAELSHLASTTQPSSQPANSGVVFARATITDSDLPLLQQGAIAQASIDCGRVPLVWLVFRDAYWAVSSSWEMYW